MWKFNPSGCCCGCTIFDDQFDSGSSKWTLDSGWTISGGELTSPGTGTAKPNFSRTGNIIVSTAGIVDGNTSTIVFDSGVSLIIDGTPYFDTDLDATFAGRMRFVGGTGDYRELPFPGHGNYIIPEDPPYDPIAFDVTVCHADTATIGTTTLYDVYVARMGFLSIYVSGVGQPTTAWLSAESGNTFDYFSVDKVDSECGYCVPNNCGHCSTPWTWPKTVTAVLAGHESHLNGTYTLTSSNSSPLCNAQLIKMLDRGEGNEATEYVTISVTIPLGGQNLEGAVNWVADPNGNITTYELDITTPTDCANLGGTLLELDGIYPDSTLTISVP